MATTTKKTPEQSPVADEVMAAVDAKIALMLEEAQKAAEEIIENAKRQAQAPGTAVNELSKQINEDMEEYVTVKLFKDSGKYSDDVFVAVNGEGCSIPRGIPVKIKKKYMTVLDQSDLQDAKTAQFMEAEAEKFLNESKARNL